MVNRVQLVPLGKVHLEMIRAWRNADEIRHQMEYTALISAQQQVEWFASLSPETDYYYIINYINTPIGLTQINQVDVLHKHANCGLFIARPEFTGTGISLAASLQLLDMAFYQLKLNYVTAKVKNTNHSAIEYNTQLGFKTDLQLNVDFTRYKVTREAYEALRNQLQYLVRYV
ncbi:MAG: GNAT family N-acetyltransferase [Bacteroidota bacterium]|jgi:RimJ/RimL family protein N-acetyltransferase